MTPQKQTCPSHPILLFVAMVAVPMLLGAASPACAPIRVAPESAWASPTEVNDVTAVVEGCGNPAITGYTYCRMHAGEDAVHKILTFIAPPAKCGAAHCVFLRVYNSDGTLVYGDSFEKGASRLDLPWPKLVGKDTFETNARGIYLFFIEVHSNNPDGNDQVSFSEGEIRLRVVSPTNSAGLPYRSLENVKEDASFVWEWRDKKLNRIVRWTQKLRASSFPLKD